MPQRDRSFYEGLLNDPRARAMLDLIAAGEVSVDGFRAGNGYDALFNGGRAKDLTKHPNVATDFQGKKTTAAGRYQFLYSTWTPLAQRLGLTDFSAQSQDIAALALADEAGALDHFLEGRFSAGLQKLGDQWASMPDSKWRHGATHSPSFFYDVYTTSLRRNDTTNKYQVPEPPINYRQTDGGNLLDAKPSGSARGDFASAPGGGGGGGGLQLNTTVDMSKIPDMSNWDTDNYTAQMMFNRYGNRRLLATRPGQWSPEANTLLSAALLEPRPPVLYSPMPFPEGQVTVMTQESGNRASPAVQPVPVQPPQPVQGQQSVGDPTFYPEQGDTPLAGPMFTLSAPATSAPVSGQNISARAQTTAAQQPQAQQQAATQQASQQSQQQTEQPQEQAQTEQAQTEQAQAQTRPVSTNRRDPFYYRLPPEYFTAVDRIRAFLNDEKNQREYALLLNNTGSSSLRGPEAAAFRKNYETQRTLLTRILNNELSTEEMTKALDPYMQSAADFTGQQVATAAQQTLLAELNPFAGMVNPVTQDLERLTLLNTTV